MKDSCTLTTRLYVAAVIIILVFSGLTWYSYNQTQKSINDSLAFGLKSTAGVMATQINASEIDSLKPGDENTPQYAAVVQKLRTMRSMNDHIVNAYIMRVSDNGMVTFIVDDLYLDDPVGSAKIGEPYLNTQRAEIFSALSVPTTSGGVYRDRWGTWVSAYAPIDDSAGDSGGNTRAVLGIDVAASDYETYLSDATLPILCTGILSIIIVLGTLAAVAFRLRKDDRTDEKK